MLRNGKFACIEGVLDWLSCFEEFMNSAGAIAGVSTMCRARASLAEKEMEYWLAEAEQWKQLRELPEPFAQGSVTSHTGYSEPN